MLDDFGVSEKQLRDTRYDAVLHLVTAADGAEEFYLSNVAGEARYESVDEAIQKDELLRYAYMGHANKWEQISNKECKDFDEKISRAKEFVLDVLGKSAGSKFAKKYLLRKVKKASIDIMPLGLTELDQRTYEEVFVSETFINYNTDEGEVVSCSVERKGSDQCYSYTLKLKLIINK